MNRLSLVMVLLCVTVFGFAKRKIDLNDHARFPQPPIEVFIDEESRELTLDLNNEVKMEGTYVLPLPMIGKGKYVLYIFLDEIELQGFFEINNY